MICLKYSIELRLNFDLDAEQLNSSVELDNGEYITSSASGHIISATARGDSLRGLLRTVDDFISCLQVAEKSMRKASPP